MSSVPSQDEALIAVPVVRQERRKSSPDAGVSRLIRRRPTRLASSEGQDAGRADSPHVDEDVAIPPDEPTPTRLQRSRLDSTWSSATLERLIDSDELERETYGATEFRDGFFDALFLTPWPADRDRLLQKAERTLPVSFQKTSPLSLRNFLPKQGHELSSLARRVTTTRSGILLAKSFLAWFVAYALCLAPATRAWLGPYAYVIVVSAVVNHPARTVGAQVDGAVLTTLGTVVGLGWGALGLWLSTVTAAARAGYGGVLAAFLCVCIGTIAALRSYFLRLYQFVFCAGVAVAYTCLASVEAEHVAWRKLLDYGVPFVLGQAISLVVCVLWFPDAGDRNLATSLHGAFGAMLDGVDIRKAQRQLTRRRLAQSFVNLSQAYRDFAIDITVSLFEPKDVLALRNLLQGVIRALLSMRTEPAVFGRGSVAAEAEIPRSLSTTVLQALMNTTVLAAPGLSDVKPGPMLQPTDARERAVRLVRYQLDEPTRDLLGGMRDGLKSCHAVLMDMTRHRRYLGPGADVEADVPGALVRLRRAMIAFDEAESALLDDNNGSADDFATRFVPEVIEVFAYCRPIRQAASAVEAALVRVNTMEQRKTRRLWPRLHLPSYPWRKALNRTGPQVRHDRGGVTAASYYRSFADIARLIRRIRSSEHSPLAAEEEEEDDDDDEGDSGPGVLDKVASRLSVAWARSVAAGTDEDKERKEERERRIRYNVWKFLHRLQGFEMRFALKTAIVTSLLAIPAWVETSRGWWNTYDSWWAVAMAWLMMHPRVGGNFQDLLTRALMAVLGAVWSGAGYAAGRGNHFVMAAFAIVYMVPMLYRFTQSSHPRSGLVGCLSFTVTSLALMADEKESSPLAIAVSRGGAFVVGVVASVVINWVIWPFIARHELRKAISGMMFFLSVVYRSIIAIYVYYDQGHNPTSEDIEQSEVLEGRLREGFVRIRQLMGLTRHEIRLRAPFDPRPYSALADACEHFFEFLVSVRQSALFFHPRFIRDNDEAVARLLTYRRDSVAAVLTNLYVLAGALRSHTPVPKYLPSAAAARKCLLDKMAEIEAEYEDDRNQDRPQLGERKRWVQIYSYSYNESLTGCVAQLEELERYTKLIVGEHGFDDAHEDSYSDEE